MVSMKTWMLGAAMVAGMAGLGAATAQAAQFGVYVGAGPAYVPPCPGPGYLWVNGYWSNGYWTAGRWEFRGHGYVRDDYRHRGWDHDPGYRGWDRDGYRHRDRDWDRGRDRDHDRGWDRH